MKVPGAKVPGPFCERAGSESYMERKGQGAKVPGSELARLLLARERKSCESYNIPVLFKYERCEVRSVSC